MTAPPPDTPAAADEWLPALVRRFELPLLQYAARIVRCPERARDVVQDTFLRLLEHGPGAAVLADGNAAARWLFTVCRNRALDVCRKENRMTYLDQDADREPPDPDPGPAEQLARKETAGMLLRLVESLPPRQQEVVQLKFQNGLSYQEISQITQLSVSNVGFLLHRALRALRERHAQFAHEFGAAGQPLISTRPTGPVHP